MRAVYAVIKIAAATAATLALVVARVLAFAYALVEIAKVIMVAIIIIGAVTTWLAAARNGFFAIESWFCNKIKVTNDFLYKMNVKFLACLQH